MDTEIIVGDEEEEEEVAEPVEQISAPKEDVFPSELVRFAEHLATTGKNVFDVFSELDLNKDGVLDGFEFREGLAAMEIADLAPWDVDALLSAVDLSGDGKIDLPELDILIMRLNNVVESVSEEE